MRLWSFVSLRLHQIVRCARVEAVDGCMFNSGMILLLVSGYIVDHFDEQEPVTNKPFHNLQRSLTLQIIQDHQNSI